jgi:hypothetical protein
VDLSALPLEEAMLLNSPSLIDNKDLEKALKIYTDKLDSQGLKGIGF